MGEEIEEVRMKIGAGFVTDGSEGSAVQGRILEEVNESFIRVKQREEGKERGKDCQPSQGLSPHVHSLWQEKKVLMRTREDGWIWGRDSRNDDE